MLLTIVLSPSFLPSRFILLRSVRLCHPATGPGAVLSDLPCRCPSRSLFHCHLEGVRLPHLLALLPQPHPPDEPLAALWASLSHHIPAWPDGWLFLIPASSSCLHSSAFKLTGPINHRGRRGRGEEWEASADRAPVLELRFSGLQ